MDESIHPLLLAVLVLGVTEAAWPPNSSSSSSSSSSSQAAWPALSMPARKIQAENVHVSNHGYSGHSSPDATAPADQHRDLATEAHTYSPYEHYASQTPQPISAYHEYRQPQTQAVDSTPAVHASQSLAESPAGRHQQPLHYATHAPPPTPTAYTTHPAPTHNAQALRSQVTETSAIGAKKSVKADDDPTDIHHELQMELSKQIQVQLEQLQKLHELQHKMLRAPKPTEPPPPAVQGQSSETVNRQVPHPGHAARYYPPPPYQQQSAPLLAAPSPGPGPGPYASITVAPSPPPATVHEPRYPEESQPLTSFIRGESVVLTTSPPSDNNGFHPIAPPANNVDSDPQSSENAEDGDVTDFQPFVEHATDPALPFYLLPPAQDSDSHYNHLRESVAAASTAPAVTSELEDLTSGPSAPSAASSEREPSAPGGFGEHRQKHRELVRGKHHRLRPPRGKHAVRLCGPSAAGLRGCGASPGAGAGALRPPTAPPGRLMSSSTHLRLMSPTIRYRPIGHLSGRPSSPTLPREPVAASMPVRMRLPVRLPFGTAPGRLALGIPSGGYPLGTLRTLHQIRVIKKS